MRTMLCQRMRGLSCIAGRKNEVSSRQAGSIIDIIVRGIGNAFYGRAVYYPNYGTRPPHNGREVRAAHRSWSTLDATALSSLSLLQIDSLQIVWYCNEEHGQCL